MCAMMGSMEGKLIVIDGNDASGKHTQALLLKKNLENSGRSAVVMDFPRYDSFFGGMVGEYLNGDYGSLTDVNPKLASLLYALDRFDEKERILGWLREGKYVILDRYVESNIAYQSAKLSGDKKREELISWIKELEYVRFGMPKPNIVFYLHVNPEISERAVIQIAVMIIGFFIFPPIYSKYRTTIVELC